MSSSRFTTHAKGWKKTLDAARNHEANGAPRGDRLYRILYDVATAKACVFVERWGGTMDDLYALYPAMVVLKNLAAKPAEVDPAAAKAKMIGFGLAAFGLVIFAPALRGVTNGVYHLVLRAFGLH